MFNETQLWTWFLFNSGLSPQRAKVLLAQWHSRNLSLQAALDMLPAQTQRLGLTKDEARTLTPPQNFSELPALRWNEGLYPQGLQELPLKLRPALLFYTGDSQLLSRPIVYLYPDPLLPNTEEMLREIISLLLGENLLLAAFHDSPQAGLLLQEMNDSEGEAMLFVREGLDQLVLPQQIQAFVKEERLVIVTPLPPGSKPKPAWGPVLEQIAIAAARRCIATTPPSEQSTSSKPTLLLSDCPVTPQAHLHVADNPMEALVWLTDIPGLSPGPDPQAPLSAQPPTPEPALTPEDILRTLETGGQVPDVLRKRLIGQ